MKTIGRICLPVCALALLPVSTAHAQRVDLADELVRCSELKDTLRRLSCFDSVARDASKVKQATPAPAAAPVPAPAPEGENPAPPPATEPAKADTPKAEPVKAAPPPPIREEKSLREADAKSIAEIVRAMPASNSANYESDGALTLTFKSSELMKLVRR